MRNSGWLLIEHKGQVEVSLVPCWWWSWVAPHLLFPILHLLLVPPHGRSARLPWCTVAVVIQATDCVRQCSSLLSACCQISTTSTQPSLANPQLSVLTTCELSMTQFSHSRTPTGSYTGSSSGSKKSRMDSHSGGGSRGDSSGSSRSYTPSSSYTLGSSSFTLQEDSNIMVSISKPQHVPVPVPVAVKVSVMRMPLSSASVTPPAPAQTPVLSLVCAPVTLLQHRKSVIVDPNDLLKTVVSKGCDADFDIQDNFEMNSASSNCSLEVQPSESSSTASLLPSPLLCPWRAFLASHSCLQVLSGWILFQLRLGKIVWHSS